MLSARRRSLAMVAAGAMVLAPVLLPASAHAATTAAATPATVVFSIPGAPGPVGYRYNAGKVQVGDHLVIYETVTNASPPGGPYLHFQATGAQTFPLSTTPGLEAYASTGLLGGTNCQAPTGGADGQGPGLAPGQSCSVVIILLPTRPGPLSVTISLYDNGNLTGQEIDLTGTEGYFIADQGGGAAYFDSAGTNYTHGEPGFVQTGDRPLNGPVVTVASTKDGKGYYEAAADGGVFAYGDAAGSFFGSRGGQHLNKPVVGMAVHYTSVSLQLNAGVDGYYEVASDGGIFNYGPDAKFYGSEGGQHLNAPVVGMALTPDVPPTPASGVLGTVEHGYYLVASDGGIFAFGGAKFYGSEGNHHLNAPIVGMAVTPDGGGYWEVASDGGIFAFGDAAFYGSEGNHHLNQPVVGMAPTPNGLGYWLEARDGGSFNFGDAPYIQDGQLAAHPGVTGIGPSAQPVVPTEYFLSTHTLSTHTLSGAGAGG